MSFELSVSSFPVKKPHITYNQVKFKFFSGVIGTLFAGSMDSLQCDK